MRKSKIRQSRIQKLRKCRKRLRQSQIRVFNNHLTGIESYGKDYIDNLRTENISVNGYYNYVSDAPLLHLAALVGNYSIFKKFIDIGADIHKQTPGNITVLHSAANSSNYNIVKYLIKNGLDVNVAIKNVRPKNGETALHIAAERGTKKVITLLLDSNANINAKSAIGITPLIKAVEARNYDAMDVLIKYAPDALFYTYKKDGYTQTIFHSAISKSNWQVLYEWLFLFADSIDVNNNDTNFFSFFKSQLLLHHAFRSIEVGEEIILYLLCVGVDVNTLDSNNKLAIDYALEFRPDSISLIKDHIVELIAAGFYVCDRNIQAVSTEEFDCYSADCHLEVEKMKKNQLEDSNITFIEILQKNERYVAPYLKSVDLNNIIDSDPPFPEYPIYDYKIYYKLRKVQKRVNYIKDSEEVIYNIFHELHFPDTFIRELYFYLSNNDLEKIIPPAFYTENTS